MRITSMADIQELVVLGVTDFREYGHVSCKVDGDLLLLNYTDKAVYAGEWNYLETVSRGLILNRKTGDVVARPFDKFFNWGEGGKIGSGDIARVTEKMDGSLIIAYYHDGDWHCATRGAFHSPQADWATAWFRTHTQGYRQIPEWYTLLFEGIYPENRIVVDYGARAELVLLAIRHRRTGVYRHPEVLATAAASYGWPLVPSYQFTEIGEMLAKAQTLDANHEGYVVEFSDGSRWKIKGQRYLDLHRLISGLSFPRTLEAVINNKVEDILGAVPDEFLDEVKGWLETIGTVIGRTEAQVDNAFRKAPQTDRKTFALWVRENTPDLAPYLFQRLDNRPIRTLILKSTDWSKHIKEKGHA